MLAQHFAEIMDLDYVSLMRTLGGPESEWILTMPKGRMYVSLEHLERLLLECFHWVDYERINAALEQLVRHPVATTRKRNMTPADDDDEEEDAEVIMPSRKRGHDDQVLQELREIREDISRLRRDLEQRTKDEVIRAFCESPEFVARMQAHVVLERLKGHGV